MDTEQITKHSVSNYPKKSFAALILFCIFLGATGAHDFYIGKKKAGFLHLGIFLIWAITKLLVFIFPPNESISSSSGFAIFDSVFKLMNIFNLAFTLTELILLITRGKNEIEKRGYRLISFQETAGPTILFYIVPVFIMIPWFCCMTMIMTIDPSNTAALGMSGLVYMYIGLQPAIVAGIICIAGAIINKNKINKISMILLGIIYLVAGIGGFIMMPYIVSILA